MTAPRDRALLRKVGASGHSARIAYGSPLSPRRRRENLRRLETVKVSAALPGAELGRLRFHDPPAFDTTVFPMFKPDIEGAHDGERSRTRRFRYVEVVVDEPGPVSYLLLRFPARVPYRGLCRGRYGEHDSSGSGGKKKTADDQSIRLPTPSEPDTKADRRDRATAMARRER